MSNANGNGDKIHHPKKRAFLAAYALTGNIGEAAKAADIHRQTHNKWLEADPVYAAAFVQAKEDAGDALETEARRRAVEGVEEPVFYKGDEVATVRKYSDVLLIFLLKGIRPDKFRDNRSVALTGANGGPIIWEYPRKEPLPLNESSLRQ